jgi:nucleoside transporter
MNSTHRVKLFIMMFLEFAIWGAWFPLIFGYIAKDGLNFSPGQQSLILNAFPIAAILAMFFSNQFADRHFAAEKFLAASHLIGGLSILALYWVQDFWTFLALMLVHCVVYVPTISITNSIAFANMKDPQKEFGIIRMGGTIGWIAVSWPLFFLITDVPSAKFTFVLAGATSLLLAGFSLQLPHTPPKPATEGASAQAWVDAFKLLGLPFMLILWAVTFLDASVHSCYFSWTGRFLEKAVGVPPNWIMPIMSIGQVAEILTMGVLGAFLKRLGYRKTMIIGILGHAVRFGVFAMFGAPEYQWLIIAANLLHGICYAFFFATVYIFVDEYFPKDIRASAQGLFNFMILGLGMLIPNFICPYLFDRVFTGTDGRVDFHALFLVPCFTAVGAALFLAVAFHPPHKIEDAAS